MKYYNFLITTLFFTLLFTGTSNVFAQTIPAGILNNIQGDSVSLDVDIIDDILRQIPEFKPSIFIYTDPIYPMPFQDISIHVETYSFSLDESTITWYLDNKLISSGLGLKEIRAKTGDSGKDLLIRAVIKNVAGEYTTDAKITPSGLSIMSESLTTVPPLYKGRALPILGSIQKFVAVTDFRDSAGRNIPDSNIVFTWKVDGETEPKASGTGKNTYIYVPREIYMTPPRKISVTAKVAGLEMQNTKTVNVSYVNPRVLMYAKSPTHGVIFNQMASDTKRLGGKEIEIVSFPLFYNKENASSLSYSWYINDKNIKTASNNVNAIIFGRQEGQSGKDKISSVIVDKINIYGRSGSNFSLEYFNTR